MRWQLTFDKRQSFGNEDYIGRLHLVLGHDTGMIQETCGKDDAATKLYTSFIVESDLKKKPYFR